MSKRKKILFLIAVLSLLVRLGLAFALRDNFLERGNRSSSISVIAENLATRGEFSLLPGYPTASNEPVYTSLIALIFIIFGKSWFFIAFVQALLSLAAAYFIYRVVLDIFGISLLAEMAFVLNLFYPFYITQSISISDTILFTFFLSLTIFLLVKAVQRKDNLIFILLGITWGFTLQVRFSAISLFFISFFYLLFHFKFVETLKKIMIIMVFCALTLLPWIIRNYSYSRNIFITSHGAVEIWLGYNPKTLETIKNDMTVDVMKKDSSIMIPELRSVYKLYPVPSIQREVAESKLYIKSAVSYALDNPWHCLKMMPLKLWKFWSWSKTPLTNSQSEKRSAMDKLWDQVYFISYFPILIFGILGIVKSRFLVKSHSVFLLLFLGYSLMHAVVYGFTRLRIPLDQFIMIYAAYAVIGLCSRTKLNIKKAL